MNVRLLSSCRVVTTALEVFFSGSGKRAGGFSGLRVAYVRQRDDRAKGNRGLNMWAEESVRKEHAEKKDISTNLVLLFPRSLPLNSKAASTTCD